VLPRLKCFRKSLSGTGGTASSQLGGLVDSKNLYWYEAASLTQPIFDAGRLRNNLRLSEAEKQEEVFTYQRTIKQAFQSVSDALIGLGNSGNSVSRRQI
jgi:outer membrane protein, multidrug efflux system